MGVLFLHQSLLKKDLWFIRQLFRDSCPMRPWELAALDPEFHVSAGQILESIKQCEASHRLAWEVEVAVEEDADVAVPVVNFDLVLVDELSELGTVSHIGWCVLREAWVVCVIVLNKDLWYTSQSRSGVAISEQVIVNAPV